MTRATNCLMRISRALFCNYFEQVCRLSEQMKVVILTILENQCRVTVQFFCQALAVSRIAASELLFAAVAGKLSQFYLSNTCSETFFFFLASIPGEISVVLSLEWLFIFVFKSCSTTVVL